MSVSSLDFYHQASSIFESSTNDLENEQYDEIALRCCVSRSYYSMYHAALEILKSQVPNYSNAGSHACLITYLESGPKDEPYDSKELIKLSYILRQARSQRVIADYKIEDEFISHKESERALASADRFLTMCKSLTSSLPVN